MIYDHACEWVYKPFWPARARWNYGTSLIRTSKQVAKEAIPSMYRTMPINGGLPLDTIERFGSNLKHVQTIEIQFSCFCPVGGPAFHHNNDTLYATRGVDVEEGFRFRMDYLSDDFVQDAKKAWTMAMDRIQAARGVLELAVTFHSCCRSAS
jgi:hypothetical protein